MAVCQCDFSGGDVIYYELSSEGEHLLDDVANVPAIRALAAEGARAVVLHPDGSKTFNR